MPERWALKSLGPRCRLARRRSAVLCPLIEVNRPLLLQCGNACFSPNPVMEVAVQHCVDWMPSSGALTISVEFAKQRYAGYRRSSAHALRSS
jgi:hypothetical protein